MRNNGPLTDLISGRRLARNALWHLLGGMAPLLVGLLAIPLLVREMGTARFGVLTLAWLVVGYFSLFDLGLGRAMTKLVAQNLGSRRKSDIPALVLTSLVFMTILGAVGSLVLLSLTPWLVTDVLEIPSSLQQETRTAFYILSWTVPFVITSIGAQSVLAAYQRFALINMVRLPVGIMNFLAPLVVMPFSNSLVPVVSALAITRLLAWMANMALCRRVLPEFMKASRLRGAQVRTLITYGGWMTISSVVGPLMIFADRFAIGTAVSMTAVAYYATPYEAITRLLVLPAALMGVLFPALSATLAVDRTRAMRLFARAVKYIFIVMFPIVLTVVTLAGPGLIIWLGPNFAQNSTLVLQILAVGVLVNSLATVPFGLLQAEGRPDLTAKVHLVEFPLYLMILWLLLNHLGIVGVAVAWTLRLALDASVLFFLSSRSIDVSLRPPAVLAWAFSVCGVLTVGALPLALSAKFIFLAIVGGAFLVFSWRSLLSDDERHRLLRLAGFARWC